MADLTPVEFETAITLAAAANLFPSRPSIYTLRRWATRGMANGAKLRTFRSGMKVCTTPQWCRDFIEESNADYDPTRPRRREQARERLDQLGI